MTSDNRRTFSRRKFLQRGIIVLGGLVVATYATRGPIRRFIAQTAENLDSPAIIANNEPLIWFEILADNTILLKSPKIEMGQGIFTGFAMLAAEELDVALEQIRVIHANTTDGPIDRINTGGSSSTLALYHSIRAMAAMIREMLKKTVAKKWSVAPNAIKTENGILSFGMHKMSYAELAKLTTTWEIPEEPILRPNSEFKFVGKVVKRIDLKPKVLGKPLFAIDATIPDMLYAVLLQSPYIGATIKTISTTEAAKFPDVIKVIEEKDLIAVVAKTRYAAEMGLRHILVEWDIPKQWQQNEIEALTQVGIGTEVNIQQIGSAESLLEKSPKQVFTQQYRTPMAVHAHMEPNGAIVHYQKDKAKMIIGTQAPNIIRGAVASALELDEDKVEVEIAFSGGGFGRRMDAKLPIAAGRISKIMDKPIQVFNTREQEFLNGIYRPQTHHILAAKINNDGNIEAITHAQATPDQILSQLPGNLGYTLLGADFISAGHGASILYNIEHRSATMWQNKLPIPTGIWRGVGMFPNTFAIESFFNELAYKTGKDPIAMRIDLLKGPDKINKRYKKVLEELAEKSGWSLAKANNIGRGIAICNDRKTIVAAVAEITITNNKIQVKKVTQVIDAGLAINPEGIRMQVEGATMMGITAALYEEVIIKDGSITTTNFDKYPMASLMDTPEINVIILEGDEEPYGVGEPPLAPIAPAIAAAVFNLTGQRLRSLPLRLV